MAKKGPRQKIGLVCTKCGSRNYLTEKSRANTPKKLVLKKYCRRCRQHTEHRETSKLR